MYTTTFILLYVQNVRDYIGFKTILMWLGRGLHNNYGELLTCTNNGSELVKELSRGSDIRVKDRY